MQYRRRLRPYKPRVPAISQHALGSLRETNTHLDEALARNYLTPDEHSHFRTLAKRAVRAGEGLKGYLEWRISRTKDVDEPPPE
jgi:hypothetical protein